MYPRVVQLPVLRPVLLRARTEVGRLFGSVQFSDFESGLNNYHHWTTDGVNRDVKSEYRDMISGRVASSSVDAGRSKVVNGQLAVTSTRGLH